MAGSYIQVLRFKMRPPEAIQAKCRPIGFKS